MPAPPYPLHPERMRKSWLEQTPLWKIPLGCLTLVLLIGVFIAVLFDHHHDVDPQQRCL